MAMSTQTQSQTQSQTRTPTTAQVPVAARLRGAPGRLVPVQPAHLRGVRAVHRADHLRGVARPCTAGESRFVLVSTLGWVSSLRGLIIPGLFQAFATFLFRQYFLNFPRELEEAAQLDGTGYWGTFWRVVVPNSKGFVAAIGTITFIGSWNAFLWPLVIAPDQNSWTVQIALSTFLTAQTINLPQLFIAATIAILPLVVMFVFLQRWIVEGAERSGISE